jgi:hypothetical protein
MVRQWQGYSSKDGIQKRQQRRRGGGDGSSLMVVAVWQCLTAAIEYAKVMVRGRWCSTMVVADGDSIR